MNDASLPKPTPPQQTTLQPNVPVTPAAPPAVPAITAPPPAPAAKQQTDTKSPPPGVPTPSRPAPAASVSTPVPTPTPATTVPPAPAVSAAPNVKPAPVPANPPAVPSPSPAAQPVATPPTVKPPVVAATPAVAPVAPPQATTPVAATPVAKPPLPNAPAAPPVVPMPPAAAPMVGAKPPGAPGTPTPTPGKPAAPPTPGAPTPGPGGVKAATVSKSPLRFLPFVLIGLVLVAIIGFVVMRMFGAKSELTDAADDSQQNSGTTRQAVTGKQVTLQYWGLWEPSAVLSEVFADYEKQNPGVKIQYTQQSHKDYRERLQTAVASGQGPDLFRFHSTWVPMLRAELSAVPSSVISAAEFKSTYYPVATKQLQSNGQIVGVPLMYDGLALLYNKEIFENSGDVPPKTWAELRSLAAKLTSRPNGTVMRGGIALGGTANVEGFSDVLGLLMLQNGADPKKPNSAQTRDALLFYTKFLSSDAVWSDALPSSSVAFARGDVAMIFAPSWRIHEILATNPNIKIGVAPLPKLSDERLTWSTFWAEGISAKSQNKEEAAKLLKYLSSPEVLKKMYTAASQVRAFGEIYPRVDMANELANDPYVGPYLADAPYADGWYMSSYTHDKGINDQIIKYYEDAINALNTGKSTDDVLKTVDQGVTQTLRQYSAQ